MQIARARSTFIVKVLTVVAIAIVVGAIRPVKAEQEKLSKAILECALLEVGRRKIRLL